MASKKDIPVSEAAEEVVNTSYDKDYWEEKVDFLVPLDMTNPSDKTLLIIINGHYFKMMRGEKVQVPRYVVEAYNEQQMQMASMFKMQEKYQKMLNLTDEG